MQPSMTQSSPMGVLYGRMTVQMYVFVQEEDLPIDSGDVNKHQVVLWMNHSDFQERFLKNHRTALSPVLPENVEKLDEEFYETAYVDMMDYPNHVYDAKGDAPETRAERRKLIQEADYRACIGVASDNSSSSDKDEIILDSTIAAVAFEDRLSPEETIRIMREFLFDKTVCEDHGYIKIADFESEIVQDDLPSDVDQAFDLHGNPIEDTEGMVHCVVLGAESTT